LEKLVPDFEQVGCLAALDLDGLKTVHHFTRHKMNLKKMPGFLPRFTELEATSQDSTTALGGHQPDLWEC